MHKIVKAPSDPVPYPQDPQSRPISINIQDGNYIYVRDLQGVIFVLPDGPHRHPRVLGRGKSATYAGDLTIRNGSIVDLTNLSGTFRFDDSEGLLEVANALVGLGFHMEPTAVRLFPMDGSRPVIL